MEILLVVLVVMLFPFAAVISRQIALTDALHRDLGPAFPERFELVLTPQERAAS